MTLFEDISVNLDDKPLDIKCANYHCKFNLVEVPAETNLTLKLVFNLAKNVTFEDFE